MTNEGSREGPERPDPPTDPVELQRELEQERRHAEQWRRVAEERRLVLETLRRHPVVDLGLRARHRLRRYEPALRPLLDSARGATSAVRRWRHRAEVVRAQATAPARRRDLEDAVARLPDAPVDPRRVAIVVVTRDGRDRLDVLLPWLRRLPGHRDVVVVDNASEPANRSWLAEQPGIRVIRLDDHRTYSGANRAGVESTDAEVVCLLNDDVEPLDDGWLDRMLSRLHGDVGVVGAQLVYPERGVLGSNRPDLTVQHCGITFARSGGGVPRAVNVGGAAPDVDEPARETAAVTGACLVVERRIWDALGGLADGYDFGAEDVDFCWRARQRGHRVVVDPSATLYHHEGATRLQASEPTARLARQAANWRVFAARHGPAVTRAVLLDRLRAEHHLVDRPLVVAITVTRDDPEAGYGDWYTADGLRTAMQRLGWDVRFVQRHRDDWYDVDEDVDVLVALLDSFDVRRVSRPGLTCVAWVRNWADRWLSRPWWREFDFALASSSVIAERIRSRSGMAATVFPLATDPSRFVPGDGDRDGVVVAMNHWGTDDRLAPVVGSLPDVRVYGRGWDEVRGIGDRWHGHVGQDDLGAIYGRAAVVLDRAGVHTRDDGSVNSRVFDALAAGAAVVTDQAAGAAELFDGDLPTYEGPSELPALLDQLHEGHWDEALQRCRQRVLENHTWDRRAQALQAVLVDHVQQDRWLVQTSAPRHGAEGWGDWHYGQDVAAALRRSGHAAWVVPVEDWESPDTAGFDVALHLRGRDVAPTTPGRTDVIWCISHPDELEPAHLDAVELVVVASDRLANDLRDRTETPVAVLPQATDPYRFRPRPDPASACDVLFVGNSRFSERPIVRDALDAGLPLTVVGRDWEGRVPADLVRQRHVSNDDLPRLYSSAGVVLNDHWEDMRRWGIVSNRVFDVLACGGVVVSDDLPELHAAFGDVVATATGPKDLRAVVTKLLEDPDGRRDRGQAGRAVIRDAHTFDHRMATLLALVRQVSGRD